MIRQRGFTLIELMIVVVIIGVLAAIAIPNFIAMQDRAKEGSTRSNMHTLQLAAEDYGIQNDAQYSDVASAVVAGMPVSGARFLNPFDRSAGDGNAWQDHAWLTPLVTGSTKSGLVVYADSSNMKYEIAGHGKITDIGIVYSSGD